MFPSLTSSERQEISYSLEHLNRVMDELGEFYPGGSSQIPWALFCLQQMSYWQSDHPYTTPHLFEITGSHTNPFPGSFLNTFQARIDQLNSPAHQEHELQAIVRLEQLSSQIRKTDSMMPPSDPEQLTLWQERKAMFAQFQSIRRRHFAMAHSKKLGVFHDGTGHIELLVHTREDLDRFLSEVLTPSWLDAPTGTQYFMENKRITVTLRGNLPEFQITRQVFDKLTHPVGNAPYLLNYTPAATVPLNQELEDQFSKENSLLPNYLHATSFQRRAHGCFKAPNTSSLCWDYSSASVSKDSLAKFDKVIGDTRKATVNEEYLDRLRISWAHFRLYSSKFFDKLTEEIDGTEMAKTIRRKAAVGINQLYCRHLDIVSGLKRLTESTADNADKILQYLREEGDWVTKRQTQRRFSINAKTRDEALEELTVRNLIVAEGRHVMARSLAQILPQK